ncbi:hypothetical protein J8F10_25905 [Gemmata sp. G18]|uniref:Uncharacterized protein n=1 Tax=Gemmata palustris TaxID=2822762 RepID=A0ABS5BYF9_9BACT|nr:hypothetical protein [Gemmata palustris]MBP3958695.1 hypothetical protein [Gemmata palustris]
MRTKLLVTALVLASAAVGRADDGLTKGTPDVKSVTALAFGPKGLLFVGDSAGAAVFAFDTGDTKPAGDKPLNVEKIDAKIASALGVTEKDVKITDLKVNPASGNVYISATRGTGAGEPALLKIARDGTVSAVALKDLAFSKVTLPNPATAAKDAPLVITQLGFVDGKVIVAGLSNEEFASTLRVIPFPFKDADKGAGIKIFHGAHGKLETNAPIRTFVAYKIGQDDNILAAYTCTPLVKIPVSDLKAGAKVNGTTIAELGNRNRPLDMIVYTKGGKDYILMANSARGVMKVPTEGVDKAEAITARPAGDTAGLKYESIKELTDVMQLDKLDDGHALLLVKNGTLHDLKTVPLP